MEVADLNSPVVVSNARHHNTFSRVVSITTSQPSLNSILSKEFLALGLVTKLRAFDQEENSEFGASLEFPCTFLDKSCQSVESAFNLFEPIFKVIILGAA